MFDLDTDLCHEETKSCDVSHFSISVCFSGCSFPYSDFQQSQAGKDTAKDSALCEVQGLHEVGTVIKAGAH